MVVLRIGGTLTHKERLAQTIAMDSVEQTGETRSKSLIDRISDSGLNIAIMCLIEENCQSDPDNINDESITELWWHIRRADTKQGRIQPTDRYTWEEVFLKKNKTIVYDSEQAL